MSGDIPRTPNQGRGECSRKSNRREDIPSGDFSPSKKQQTDDQSERNQPDPIFSICNLLLSPEDYRYTSMVLTPAAVDLTNPVLRISNHYGHFVFLNNHSFVDEPGVSGSIPYRVYDKYNNQYNMRLSRTGSMQVSLSEWDTLVRGCGLKAGDVLRFYRYLDTTISDDFVYFLKNDYKTPQAFELSTSSSTTKPVLRIIYPQLPLPLPLVTIFGYGPGSRFLPPQGHCISKTLTWYDVFPLVGKLFLNATDAVILTDIPRIVQVPTDGYYEKDIKVFDVQNREYTMTVSAINYRGFTYCLGGQWIDFFKTYYLEQGDQLEIYKCLDSTISPRYYHVFRHVYKKAVGNSVGGC